ncbi:peptidylprolyl isomerase [Wenyingzhuangia sp. chi5]|uniref:Peptidylprolyl isomerase n=1 Tax=Wenyingzhuangia gilva TaxID=3057677 RepID=A0ABT8VN96_9FLAO|nr:peptidylprolyl isomerase [Wenyingzhuangia sp. chi5]MDO3693436.1 peptidylprolyl isomerase [Wenyingzhuangia sp. chi5]
MNKYFLGIAMLLMCFSTSAQKKDKVLFKIDGEPTYVSEFTKLFKQKDAAVIEQDFKKDLQLMVDYKLKLKQSKAEGLDTLSSIKKELNKYKRDLAAPFLTDDATLENLLQEAYYRTVNKIKASHILIAFKGNDTIEAYNKIKDIQAQIKNGVDFGDLAIKYSDDKSALQNRGELGYFTAFRMVYPFEDAAYNTPVGQVSDIVKSQFGYHIIKVDDLAKSEGKVKVAHIMVAGLDASKKAKIDSIYQKLENGEDYATLAKKYSDDKGSSNSGGVLQAFEKGRLPAEFEEVAFSMSEPNAYSKPFKTPYGWHIVKFIEKEPIKPFDELKEALKKKILNDERGKKPKEVAFAKMEAKNKLEVNKEAKAIFESNKVYNTPIDSLQNVLFTINEQPYLQADFLEYVKNRRTQKPLDYFQEYKNQQLKEYVIDHLQDQNEEYRAILESYQNGLEIFELMKVHIWDVPAKEPELVKAFYQENIENYKDKGEKFEDVKGYVESDYQDKVQKEWIQSLRNQSKVKYNKRQVKKLEKSYK